MSQCLSGMQPERRKYS